MSQNCFILGGGGHAKVLLDALHLSGCKISGYSALTSAEEGLFKNLPFFEANDELASLNPSEVSLVNGLGSVGNPSKRKQLYDYWTSKGFDFHSVLHPNAVIAEDTVLSKGVQIMAGAVIQSGTAIGDNTIVNTRASVDHDCQVGRHVHISPGATICGNVMIEDEAHIGAGAVIRQSIRIGKGSVVGAGAVVVRDVLPGQIVAGVPAKEVKK